MACRAAALNRDALHEALKDAAVRAQIEVLKKREAELEAEVIDARACWKRWEYSGACLRALQQKKVWWFPVGSTVCPASEANPPKHHIMRNFFTCDFSRVSVVVRRTTTLTRRFFGGFAASPPAAPPAEPASPPGLAAGTLAACLLEDSRRAPRRRVFWRILGGPPRRRVLEDSGLGDWWHRDANNPHDLMFWRIRALQPRETSVR